MRALAAVLALLAAGCAGVADAPLPILRIGVIGDQTGVGSGRCASDKDLATAYAVLDAGVRRLNTEDLHVVLHTGDLVESCRDDWTVNSAFQRATGILGRLRAEWLLTPGDHDVNPPAFVPDSDDRSRDRLFKGLYQRIRPEAGKGFYIAKAGGYLVVALNSQESLHADPRWGAILLAAISGEQREWLEDRLPRYGPAHGIVVFLHQPLWLNWTGWAEVHRVLRRHPTAIVIAGHLHYDQDDGEIDGIRYITVGATGGRLKNADARSGGRHQVAVVEVQGRRLTNVRILELDGGERRPSPREQMDRVQMLDVMLGGLWGFGLENPVRLRDGRLVAACDKPEPARLAIAMLGNPLDVPLTVRVLPREGSIAGGFDPQACGTTPAACTLRPGARIAIANLSSVEVSKDVGPLWSGAVQGSAPAPGTSIELDVRLAFDAGDGERTIERRLATTVIACP